MNKKYESECAGCKSIEMVTDIDINGKNFPLCKKCRKTYNHQTVSDIIDELLEKTQKPKDIIKKLDEVVIGQADAKKALAYESYMHFARLKEIKEKGKDGAIIKKNNIILTGESGTGKTLLVETLAKILDVPFASVSATSLTESGYVGNDIESCLSRLLINSGFNPKKAEFGIVFIDEIDKKARKSQENTSITRDVSGEGVQQGLLTMVAGAVIGVPEKPGRINPSMPLVDIDTTNILFICGGAFPGIEDIVNSRLNTNTSIGFSSGKKKELMKIDNPRELVNADDLISYGMIPEFMGRFPVVKNLKTLTVEDIKTILKNKNGLIDEQKEIFTQNGVKLIFEEEALDIIAKQAIDKKLGARGLRSAIVDLMMDIVIDMTESDKKEYIVTSEYTKERLK